MGYFDGLSKNKINQNTKIQIESNKLELYVIKQEIQKNLTRHTSNMKIT